MKRLLAIILSLAMLIGAVPAVFAEGEATAVNSPTYLFTADAFVSKVDGTPLSETSAVENVFENYELDRTKSTGEWSYIVKESVNSNTFTSKDSDPYWAVVVTNSNAVLGQNVLGLKLEVEKSGTYIPKLTQFVTNHDDARINIFLVPGKTHTAPTTANDLRAFITEATADTATDIKYIFQDEKTNGDGTSNWAENTTRADAVVLERGTYYLVISIGKAENITWNVTANLKSLTFESQPYVAVSASTTVEKNKTTNVVGGKIYDGEGNELGTPASYTYTTSDSNIATVDATTGLVTGIAAGTARITVTAEYNGTEYTGSVDITVTDPDIFEYTPLYLFSKDAYLEDGTTSTPLANITKDTVLNAASSGKWWYEASVGLGSTLTMGTNAVEYYVNGQDNKSLGRNALVLAAEVEHSGKYIPTFKHYPQTLSNAKLHVFIVPEDMYVKDAPLNTIADAIAGEKTDVIYAFKAVDNYKTTATDGGVAVGEEIELEKGTYYFFISVDAQNSYHPNSSLSNRFYVDITSIELERTGPLPEGEEPGDEPEDTVQTAPETVAYATNIDGVISVMGTGITRGTEVTVTAPEVTDKVFRHWVLGTATNGTWVSDLPTYTFPLMTNTYLTAVYTDAPAENAKIVEFFNYSGEYLTQKTVDAEGKVALPTDEPSLTGYVFSRWLLAKDTPVTEATVFTNAITRVVAELTATGSYTVNGAPYTYDDKISDSSNEEVEWYRDGILVGYGTTYDYFVWDDVTAITNAPISGAKAPVVVLDDAVKAGKACMIEYDAAGKTIKEVGILFGATDEIDVDSCDSKATSQRKNTHGQFTAKPRTDGNASYARGYIIYEDSGLKVKYTDAISLPNN